MKAKLAVVSLVLAVLGAPGLAKADTVTDWNRTLVAGLEAAHTAPQPTPPLFGPPLFRQFANMTPWALTSPSQFLPAGPPASTSARWAHDLAEVQAVGSATSTVRTAWQTETAVFWQSDTAIAVWNRV